MAKTQLTSKNYFRSNRIIHGALVIGSLLFAMVSIFLLSREEGTPATQEGLDVFVFILPLFVLGIIMAHFIMFKKLLLKAKNMEVLTKKTLYYRSALIVSWALLNGATLFAITIYLVENDLMYLAIGVVPWVILLRNFPSLDRAIKELELTGDERLAVNDPNAIIMELPN